MTFIKEEILFYGLDGINDKIDSIIDNLGLTKQYFEIKLITMEALNNAFVHGNNCTKDKSICLFYKLNSDFLEIKVEDQGTGFKNVTIPSEISETNILDESGRGLFIIKNYCDEVVLHNNSIIMKLKIS